MKDGVNLHGGRESEAIGDRGEFRSDFEGTISARRELCSRMVGFQITALEPYLFAFLELDWNEAFF
jgi:hypothetical protein